MYIDVHLRYVFLLIVLAIFVLSPGCSVSQIVRQTNGDFGSGLEGWEVEPVESVLIVGEERFWLLNISSEKQIRILKKWPLSPQTEIVRISFKVRCDIGDRESDGHGNPVFMFNLQEPVGYGNYRTGGLAVNPHGSWETHEVLHIFTGRHANPRFVQQRPLSTELVFEIVPQAGLWQFPVR
jgi:hypothetical protein